MPAIPRSVKIDPFPKVMWFAGLPNGSFLLQIGMVFKNFLTCIFKDKNFVLFFRLTPIYGLPPPFRPFWIPAGRFPNEAALTYKWQGQRVSFSTQHCLHKINQVSAFWLRMGLHAGDRAAIIARHGSPYWKFFGLGHAANWGYCSSPSRHRRPRMNCALSSRMRVSCLFYGYRRIVRPHP